MDRMMEIEAARLLRSVVQEQSEIIISGLERLAGALGRSPDDLSVLMVMCDVVSECNGILLKRLANWRGEG